ncbi:MAG: RHS repeat-associated core domain-containing protein [Pirellulaceae bacterium]|nr:RHS repeat-associated core domain-containing protein [Pirellulaceae bacterium]
MFNETDKNEQTLYSYDANDRLTSEMYTGTQTTQEEPQVTTTTNTSQTTYAYNKTQQTSKTKVEGTIATTQTFSYNRQGLMASVITETSNESELKRVDYSYDTAGNRVGSSQYEASTQSPVTWTLQTSTRYLTDSQNPTGYSQVLQETHYSGGGLSKKIIYTVAHDQISQATFTIDTSGLQTLASNLFFGTDGHGSVRLLYDAAAAIAQQAGLQQIYQYDAYGNLLMIGQVSHLSTITPLTTYLYSGESFDFCIGQQYLRARWYDPRTGRFNQLDPFAGNSSDPQSFHKYAYVHGDPVNGVDPSGEFAQLLAYTRNAVSSSAALSFARSAISLLAKHWQLAIVANLLTRVRLDTADRPQSINVVNRVSELAELANASYDGYSSRSVLGGAWRQLEIPDRLTDSVGYTVKGWTNGQGRVVIGFAGTDDLYDVAVDAINVFGVTTSQYRRAISIADWAVNTFGQNSVEFTGHSLGGGLAAAAAYRTGRPATTFNAAGISLLSYTTNAVAQGLSPIVAKPSITNYYVPGDALSLAQDYSFLVNASGIHIALPNPAILMRPSLKHKMATVLMAIDDWRREISGS